MFCFPPLRETTDEIEDLFGSEGIPSTMGWISARRRFDSWVSANDRYVEARLREFSGYEYEESETQIARILDRLRENLYTVIETDRDAEYDRENIDLSPEEEAHIEREFQRLLNTVNALLDRLES